METKETKKIAEIRVPEGFKRISFNVNTPFLNKQEIEQKFQRKVEKPTGNIGFLIEMLSVHTKSKSWAG
jgi:hypothetical protein